MDTQTDCQGRTREDRPTKICTVCGGAIVWKRWLDRDWCDLKYCGAICRRNASAMRRGEALPQRFLASDMTQAILVFDEPAIDVSQQTR